MERKFRITVDGMPYMVIVEELSETTAVPAVHGSLPAAAPAAPVRAAPAPSPAAVPGATTPDDKLSPLGGVVASIEVAVGAEVKEGQKLLVIEAMKMKTPVTAHKSGKITRIAVHIGDPVEAGQLLATIA